MRTHEQRPAAISRPLSLCLVVGFPVRASCQELTFTWQPSLEPAWQASIATRCPTSSANAKRGRKLATPLA